MDARTQLASLAVEELDKGDFLMATKILTTGIRLEPNNHELYFERSICHHKLGEYQASLEDANSAIRLNPSDYNIYYQKGLALIGLSLRKEAICSFKKAIELRARQEDSKLSDIFKLLRDATNELDAARKRSSALTAQAGITQTAVVNKQLDDVALKTPGNSRNDPVDSTTDRPSNQPGILSIDQQVPTTTGNVPQNNDNKLVAASCNNITTQNRNGIIQGVVNGSNVTSSANQFIDNRNLMSVNVSQAMSNVNVNSPPDVILNSSNQHMGDSKSQFEWNIRRSERIFLHQTEPGASGQFGMIPMQGEPGRTTASPKNKNSIQMNLNNLNNSVQIHSDNGESNSFQINRSPNTKEPGNPSVELDVDVDDSYNSRMTLNLLTNDGDSSGLKRPMPSGSSQPTDLNPTLPPREASYSSKCKRLRRDRERARRGTSKLCTIKLSDLEELQRHSKSNSERGMMRVIAPIDGWLYSGQMSIFNGPDNNPQYIVKLDGDSTGSNYLFTQESVLNDVIKEVRVKSVSDLRKGARICCYWSRTYKCLSTGIVTSRTFEPSKSLVSVKYDNGDLSALPLEDLRLLPPDYPKYMSNCDPLPLARNSDGNFNMPNSSTSGSRIIVRAKSAECNLNTSSETAMESTDIQSSSHAILPDYSPNNTYAISVDKSERNEGIGPLPSNDHISTHACQLNAPDSDESAIPPTNETIDFITSEGDEERSSLSRSTKIVAKDSSAITVDPQMISNASRASSEENNYGIEYRPWMFEGPKARRSKRHSYNSIRRGSEVLRVGDSAELMPKDESILPFIAKIDGLWANSKGEMKVRVRWYYRLSETTGDPYDLQDGDNALFETDHIDENDVQSIIKAVNILSWTNYCNDYLGHQNKHNDGPKVFYLAGYYDPVNYIKHLKSDVKEAL